MQKFLNHLILICMVSVALMATVACGHDEETVVHLRDSGTAEASTPVVNLPSDIISRLEVPALKDGNTFVYHKVQFNGHKVMNYCLEFDPNKMHSRWVAFRFDGETRLRNVSRSDAWSDDPELPSSMWVGTEYFSSYNRGHLVASNDRRFCLEANQQTFYMSNMSPQIGNFNSPYWARLEQLVQELGWNVSFADTLYVVKGGYIDNANDLKGYITRPNGKSMAVPGHYFMALLRVKGTTYNAVGFWLQHKSYPYGGDTHNVPITVFLDHLVTIDRLEAYTGIDFFHNLPDDIENRVEAETSSGLWLK